jgi:beta-lactamase class C
METGMTSLTSRRQALTGSLLAIPALACRPRKAHAQTDQSQPDRVVNAAIGPVMERSNVPGLAVAISVEGKQHFFNYGVASKASGQKVTKDTIFEVGSISKTFTATLASCARARGALSLSDNASKYWPVLAGSSFDRISLLDLATYTAGGLPLQFPTDVTDQEQMIAYYRNWRPAYAAGSYRLYSNVSIALFGYLVARSMGRPFDDLMEQWLIPALGLSQTFIKVPRDQMGNYAYGYSKDNKPIRVTPGVLDSETYGVKTTAANLIRFVEANMGLIKLDQTLQRAITDTHTGYFKAGALTQDLAWEQYPYPVTPATLLEGNGAALSSNATPVTAITPPQQPREDVWINKTGSTNGFGAYVAFVPQKRLGIVILANKSFPIDERVTAAYEILSSFADYEN